MLLISAIGWRAANTRTGRSGRCRGHLDLGGARRAAVRRYLRISAAPMVHRHRTGLLLLDAYIDRGKRRPGARLRRSTKTFSAMRAPRDRGAGRACAPLDDRTIDSADRRRAMRDDEDRDHRGLKARGDERGLTSKIAADARLERATAPPREALARGRCCLSIRRDDQRRYRLTSAAWGCGEPMLEARGPAAGDRRDREGGLLEVSAPRDGRGRHHRGGGRRSDLAVGGLHRLLHVRHGGFITHEARVLMTSIRSRRRRRPDRRWRRTWRSRSRRRCH